MRSALDRAASTCSCLRMLNRKGQSTMDDDEERYLGELSISGTNNQLDVVWQTRLPTCCLFTRQCSALTMLLTRFNHRSVGIKSLRQCRTQSTATRTPPFTTAALSEIRSLLSPTFAPGIPLPPHTAQFVKRPASEAAVLIPLMNIDGRSHVLMEVRATHMRSHGGEIRQVIVQSKRGLADNIASQEARSIL